MTQGQLALHVQQTHHTAIMDFAVPPLILAIPTLSMIPQVRMHTTICIYAPLLTLPYLNLMPIDRNSHFCIIILL